MAQGPDFLGQGFSAYRTRPASRRGLVVAGLTLALLSLVLPARADGPEWGPSPFVLMTVTPDDALSDGQMVTVQAGSFPLHVDVVIRECTAGPQGPVCDQTALGTANAGTSRDITATVAVKRIINTGTTTYNCAVTACSLVAFPARGDWTRHHISFAGAGTSVPESTAPTTAPTATTSATTVPTDPTITIGTTIPPTTTTLLPGGVGGFLCDLIRTLRGVLGGLLGGLFDGLLNLFGCPPSG